MNGAGVGQRVSNVNGIDIVTVDASGDIVLNMGHNAQRAFKFSEDINAAKDWSFLNTTNAIEIPFVRFTVGTANVVQSLPASVEVMQGYAGDWNDATKEWTPTAIGDYLIKFETHNNGTTWYATIKTV